MKSMSVVPSILAVLALAGRSLAGHWYVDAAHGSDANSGNSPSQAWHTITHALATAPSPPMGGTQVVHVAPGTYDAALGETYPIYLRDAFQIVGDQGASATILDAGGAQSVLRAQYGHFGGNWTGPLTLVRALTLRNASRGMDLGVAWGPMYMSVEDTRITGMSGTGFYAISNCNPGCGFMTTKLTRVEISGCQVGIESQNLGAAAPSLRLFDCDVSDNVSTGIRMLVGHGAGPTSCTLTRTRILGNGADGVLIDNQNPLDYETLSLRLLDCLVARNDGGGIRAAVPGSGTPMNIAIAILRCTIADNAATGLDVFYPVDPFGGTNDNHTTLTGSILFGNQDDVRENPANPSISPVGYCDIGDGDFAGSNGNFSADPMFRNAVANDYRLVWGSPCVDAGDPAAPAGIPDLASVVRPVDGDLDVVEQSDVGAHEFAPLGVASQAHIGSSLVLELWGPAGGQANLLFSRRPLAPTPQSTPFGDFDLDPTHTSDLGASPVAPGPPHFRSLPIPNDPAYIGRSFSFQARATSTVGNPPTAYTNPVRTTILP